MRLGGFVIHGNNADTLGPCLDSLQAVADEVVAVDSCSRDGSAELVRERGVRHVVHPWEGYGAARAAAAKALAGFDYLLYLDSDERLLPDAIEALRRWKASRPDAPYYALVLRDWAELPTGRFLFRTQRTNRLVRADHAVWTPRLIVHESLPPDRTVRLPIAIEHRFTTSVEDMRAKVERYAMLWAVRFHAEGRRAKPPEVERAVHFAREALLKGSVFRGGTQALRLAAAVAHHHARKYALLREVERGGHRELVRAYAEGRLAELYRMLPR
jgi:glycosyltransferase involved in cell wall biosynthesis